MSERDSIADEFQETPEPESPEEEETSPWGMIWFGVFMIALGIGGYIFFGRLETEGGSVRMPALLILIYEIIGKTGILVSGCLLGAFGVWAGVSDLRNGDDED